MLLFQSYKMGYIKFRIDVGCKDKKVKDQKLKKLSLNFFYFKIKIKSKSLYKLAISPDVNP